MSREIWVSHCPKAGLQTTQLQGLFSGLTEHEQEMISDGGRAMDAMIVGVLDWYW
jgi:hypothetical protein